MRAPLTQSEGGRVKFTQKANPDVYRRKKTRNFLGVFFESDRSQQKTAKMGKKCNHTKSLEFCVWVFFGPSKIYKK